MTPTKISGHHRRALLQDWVTDNRFLKEEQSTQTTLLLCVLYEMCVQSVEHHVVFESSSVSAPVV